MWNLFVQPALLCVEFYARKLGLLGSFREAAEAPKTMFLMRLALFRRALRPSGQNGLE
jgi:hypothetical protein